MEADRHPGKAINPDSSKDPQQMGARYTAQAGLPLLGSHSPPVQASQCRPLALHQMFFIIYNWLPFIEICKISEMKLITYLSFTSVFTVLFFFHDSLMEVAIYIFL